MIENFSFIGLVSRTAVMELNRVTYVDINRNDQDILETSSIKN